MIQDITKPPKKDLVFEWFLFIILKWTKLNLFRNFSYSVQKVADQ